MNHNKIYCDKSTPPYFYRLHLCRIPLLSCESFYSSKLKLTFSYIIIKDSVTKIQQIYFCRLQLCRIPLLPCESLYSTKLKVTFSSIIIKDMYFDKSTPPYFCRLHFCRSSLLPCESFYSSKLKDTFSYTIIKHTATKVHYLNFTGCTYAELPSYLVKDFTLLSLKLPSLLS